MPYVSHHLKNKKEDSKTTILDDLKDELNDTIDGTDIDLKTSIIPKEPTIP